MLFVYLQADNVVSALAEWLPAGECAHMKALAILSVVCTNLTYVCSSSSHSVVTVMVTLTVTMDR